MERPGGYDLSAADEVYEEGFHPELIAGGLEISKSDIEGDAHNIFNDKRKIKGYLRRVVHSLHDDGKEIFARVTAHQTLAITIISSAAFAAGMVGIGVRVRRRGERKK